MPEQFDRWAALTAVSERLGVELQQLVSGVYSEGVKDGIAGAAQSCRAAAEAIRAWPVVTEVSLGQAAIAEYLADQIQLSAHTIPDPKAAGDGN